MDKEIEFLKESNAIEGEYSEVSLEDSKQAWTMAKLYAKEDFSIDYILAIHRRVMKRVNPRIAGRLREVNVGVRTKEGFKEATPHYYVKEKLREWCHNWNILIKPIKGKKVWREILCQNLHIKFEKIHPFEDGNGRVGRILMNIHRLNVRLPLLIIHEGKEQQEYYEWFKERRKPGGEGNG